MLYFRTLGFCLGSILWMFLSIFPMPILFLRRAWVFKYGVLCFAVFRVLLKTFCKIFIKVEGEENIPKTKAFILASKHVSAWETFFFAEYFKIPVYIAKKVLLQIPVFGWYMWRAGMIGIDRKGGKSTRDQLLEASIDVLRNQKRILIIFPQGTRTPINEQYSLTKYPYKKGIIAVCSAMPEVQVLLSTNNSIKYFGKGFFSIKKPGTITVKFLPAIQMKEKSGDEFLLEMQNVIETETNKII